MSDARQPEDHRTPDAAQTPDADAPREGAAGPVDDDRGPTGSEPTDAGDADRAGDDAAGTSGSLDLDALADADPRSKVELLGALVRAEEERDEYLDDLRRSHADFENYRKRVMRESASQRDAGKTAVVEPLLEVLDDLDRTLQAAESSEDTSLAKGVELVAGKLARALQSVGVQRIDETGVTFDPSVHEAVQEQPAEEPTDEPRVTQVLRPGYALGERTLRAAMVVVEQ